MQDLDQQRNSEKAKLSNTISTHKFRLRDPEQNYFITGQFLSASALLHSQTKVSFSKASRFPSEQKLQNSSSSYTLQNTQSNRSTSFGYGQKQMHHQYVLTNAKVIPAPNLYYNERVYKNKQEVSFKGATSNNQYFPHLDQLSPELAGLYPGPGNYNIQLVAGSQASKYTFGTKSSNSQEKQMTPSSSEYFPQTDLSKNTRFNAIGIGYGKKYDLTANFEKTPGPGAYNVKSKFDNLRKSRKQLKFKEYNSKIFQGNASELSKLIT